MASLDRPAEAERVLDSQSYATFFRAGDGQGYLMWVVRGSLVAQRFDPASAQLSGAPIPVSGIDGVAAYAGR